MLCFLFLTCLMFIVTAIERDREANFKWSFDVDNCACLSYYAESSGNVLPTFQDNWSVLPSEGENPKGFEFLKIASGVCKRIVFLNFLPTFRDNLSFPPSKAENTKDLDFLISYRRFGKTYRSHLQKPRFQKDLDFLFSYRRFGTTFRSHL